MQLQQRLTIKNTAGSFDKFAFGTRKTSVSLEKPSTSKGDIEEPNGTASELQHYALNEIFFAERDPSHPVSHALFFDGEDEDNYKKKLSSGLLACTGTGSTAW